MWRIPVLGELRIPPCCQAKENGVGEEEREKRNLSADHIAESVWMASVSVFTFFARIGFRKIEQFCKSLNGETRH